MPSTASPTTFDAGTLKFAQTVANLDLVRKLETDLVKSLSFVVGSELRVENYQIIRGDDASFVERFKAVRRANKVHLGSIFEHQLGVRVDPDALFDVQIKRIHEYKRQHLNILRVITLYRHLKEKRALSEVPRVVILSGKAAPGYYMAKLIIQLIAELKQRGDVSMIVIAHNYVHVFEICDRVNLLRNGRIAFDKPTDETSIEELTSIVASEYRLAKPE